MSSTVNTLDFYSKWKEGAHTENSIINELRQYGFDSLQIIETLQQFKKKQLDERQTLGFIITSIGAFLGFVSCVMTMLDIFPDLRGFMLYGLTSLALVFIFIGLYYIFE